MPVRFETSRAPRTDLDLERLGDTVVDLAPLVEELARKPRRPTGRTPAAKPEASRAGRASMRPPRPRRRKRGRTQAPQDDAALFDAARCDFASLVKRLDEELGRG
jgi:hypothetical protein